MPPFAYWTPDARTKKGPEVSEIVDNKLGWDITDFGRGDFNTFGLFLFTIRNANNQDWQALKGKLYAEKIMIVEDGQVAPMHFHWNKIEDIFNRGGGDLIVQLYNATADEQLDEKNEVHVSRDGVRCTVKASDTVRLAPGKSISLEQHCYHKFWSRGRVLVAEVSLVNDDQHDNRFYEPIDRFPEIDEGVPPFYPLCNDYARYYRSTSAAGWKRL